jgi:hypothetical protein
MADTVAKAEDGCLWPSYDRHMRWTMAREIKHADVLSEALVLTLQDGREAIIKHKDVIECAENTASFQRALEMRSRALEEDEEPISDMIIDD